MRIRRRKKNDQTKADPTATERTLRLGRGIGPKVAPQTDINDETNLTEQHARSSAKAYDAESFLGKTLPTGMRSVLLGIARRRVETYNQELESRETTRLLMVGHRIDLDHTRIELERVNKEHELHQRRHQELDRGLSDPQSPHRVDSRLSFLRNRVAEKATIALLILFDLFLSYTAFEALNSSSLETWLYAAAFAVISIALADKAGEAIKKGKLEQRSRLAQLIVGAYAIGILAIIGYFLTELRVGALANSTVGVLASSNGFDPNVAYAAFLALSCGIWGLAAYIKYHSYNPLLAELRAIEPLMKAETTQLDALQMRAAELERILADQEKDLESTSLYWSNFRHELIPALHYQAIFWLDVLVNVKEDPYFTTAVTGFLARVEEAKTLRETIEEIIREVTLEEGLV
jgi:hypothetical protein